MSGTLVGAWCFAEDRRRSTRIAGGSAHDCIRSSTEDETLDDYLCPGGGDSRVHRRNAKEQESW